jgi:hypothetical protein
MTNEAGSTLRLPANYYVGWDVGAWNCDGGSSRDALVVLEDGTDGPTPTGRPWWSNLRSLLDGGVSGSDLVLAVLDLCKVVARTPFVVTIAIDTPLGWPKPMLDLLANGSVVAVPEKADANPYLFRKSELALFGHDHRPLSSVRDMIGSQSTKGIHFLTRAGLSRSSVGVWVRRESRGHLTAIETYPAPCRKSEIMARWYSRIAALPVIRETCSNRPNTRADVEDALRCAVVAWLYTTQPGSLVQPDGSGPVEEGWIWLPADCLTGMQEQTGINDPVEDGGFPV